MLNNKSDRTIYSQVSKVNFALSELANFYKHRMVLSNTEQLDTWYDDINTQRQCHNKISVSKVTRKQAKRASCITLLIEAGFTVDCVGLGVKLHSKFQHWNTLSFCSKCVSLPSWWAVHAYTYSRPTCLQILVKNLTCLTKVSSVTLWSIHPQRFSCGPYVTLSYPFTNYLCKLICSHLQPLFNLISSSSSPKLSLGVQRP